MMNQEKTLASTEQQPVVDKLQHLNALSHPSMLLAHDNPNSIPLENIVKSPYQIASLDLELQLSDDIIAMSSPKNLPQSARFPNQHQASVVARNVEKNLQNQVASVKYDQLRFTYAGNNANLTPLPPISGRQLGQSYSGGLSQLPSNIAIHSEDKITGIALQQFGGGSRMNKMSITNDNNQASGLLQTPEESRALLPGSHTLDLNSEGSKIIHHRPPLKHRKQKSLITTQQMMLSTDLKITQNAYMTADKTFQTVSIAADQSTLVAQPDHQHPQSKGRKRSKNKKNLARKAHAKMLKQQAKETAATSLSILELNNQNSSQLNQENNIGAVELFAIQEKETLPTMIQTQNQHHQSNVVNSQSSNRRTNHKSSSGANHHKKSAEQHHRSKDRQRTSFHGGSHKLQHYNAQGGGQGGQGGGNNARTFSLVVSHNGQKVALGQPHQANNVISHKSNQNTHSSLGNNHSKQQQRVQSTAPKLFSYKPQLNEIGKSPFLQPIVSQKNFSKQNHNQQNGIYVTGQSQQIVIGTHGQQVMATMFKHQQQQQQAPLMNNHQMKQQHNTQNMNSRGSNPLLSQQNLAANMSQNSKQLTVIPAPLPKFLTKKNERQQQLLSQTNADTTNVTQANTSILDTFIKQSYPYQQNNNLNAGLGQSSTVSPKHASTTPTQDTIAHLNLMASQNGRNSVQPPSGPTAHMSDSVNFQNHNHHHSLYNDSATGLVVPGAKQPKQSKQTIYNKTLPASLHQQQLQQQQIINGQMAQAVQNGTNGNTPMVSYLMHLQQPISLTQKPDQGVMNHDGKQPTLHRSSSNTIQLKNNNLQRTVDNAQNSFISSEHQGHFYATKDKMIKHHVQQPNLMVLGQSPSNQRLVNSEQHQPHAKSGIPGAMMGQRAMKDQQQYLWLQNQHQMQQQFLKTPSSGGQPVSLANQQQVNDRLNNAGKQVLMLHNSQQQVQGRQTQDRLASQQPKSLQQQINFQQSVLSNSNLIIGGSGFTQAQQNAGLLYQGGQHHMIQSHGQNVPVYLKSYPSNSMPLQGNNFQNTRDSDDDDGIDERFDGDSGDSCGGDDPDYMLNDEHTSPRAPKPRPLDQHFVPEKGKKYFSVLIGYPAMRRALRARGWIEVKCYKKMQHIAGYTSSPGTKGMIGYESTIQRQFDANVDLKFVLSAQDANHQNLKKGCIMNQNRGEGHLTCKSGLKESLFRAYQHTACWYPMEHCDPKGLGPEAFFPRSHTINSPETLQEFQRDFVLTEAENYLRKFIKKLKEVKEKGLRPPKGTSALARTQTPSGQTRSPSKNKHSFKKKSTAQLSSAESSPVKDPTSKISGENSSPPKQTETPNTAQYGLQDLGFLKEKLLVCCNIIRKRLKVVEDKLDSKKGIRSDRHTAGTITMEERSFLLRSPKTISQAYLKYIQKEDWYSKAVTRFPQFKKDKSLTANLQQAAMCDKISGTCQQLIEDLRANYPQTDMNGLDNLWIVKPGGLSRGRKIRLFKDFQKILEYAEVDAAAQLTAATSLVSSSNPHSGQTTQYYMNSHEKPADEANAYTKKTWVIQKYIENPLLILKRKLDIRVWVVIPTWNPLKIYLYKECYMRFSCNDYDPRCPQNLFSHLTNNSVAKKAIERPDNAKTLGKIPGNMWSLNQFKEWLGGKPVKSNKSKKNFPEAEELARPKTATASDGPQPNTENEQEQDYMSAGSEIWESKWYPQIKEIVIQSILSAWDKIEWRKGGVGLYGLDIFPDVDHKLWLIEINKCPTMEYSTKVTKDLVPKFLDDMTELITDKRKGDHPEVGGFERVFHVPKLRDLNDFDQQKKDLKVVGKGIDEINNQNYLSALHRNKRQANPPGHKGHYKHNY